MSIRSLRSILAFAIVALTSMLLAVQSSIATAMGSTATADSRINDARYRSQQIQGIDVAYREAGDPGRPAIVLLHGFPTSSHMFRELIPQLASRYHVIAPDYPGFGASEMPALAEFDYSFANFATIIDELLQRKGIERYALYVMLSLIHI